MFFLLYPLDITNFNLAEAKENNWMKKVSESAGDLKKLIKHAIEDLEVTSTEYQQIMDCALADGHLDEEEQALLAQFQTMIANGTLTRVKG